MQSALPFLFRLQYSPENINKITVTFPKLFLFTDNDQNSGIDTFPAQTKTLLFENSTNTSLEFRDSALKGTWKVQIVYLLLQTNFVANIVQDNYFSIG